MIDAARNRVKTLDVVEWIAAAGRGNGGVSAFLEEVCGAVAEAFQFDSVAAMRFDTARAEVDQLAFADAARADRTGSGPSVSVSLLREAEEKRSLVFGSNGYSSSAFVLPLISGDRCLAFLYGTRGAASSAAADEAALTAVGVIAATLLEDALVREELEERDVLKSEYIALASHELRNPLSSIYGISVTLNERDDQLADTQREALTRALQEQATRMRDLVEQLLDLSRLDLAPVRISPERLCLRREIEELVRPLANGNANALTIAVPADLEVVLDPTALDRMLSNLVANSLRHGRPPVTVTAEGANSHLRLAVEDRGRGVPPEFVPRLFDRFARSSESRRRGDGSGLGLAIAQAYARAHGGEIVYEAVEPHGARFAVVIPLGEQRGRETAGGQNGAGCLRGSADGDRGLFRPVG